MRFGRADWRNFNRGAEREWLVTNGLGGFASGTLVGANTRRYHGLLTAALDPPTGRVLLWSKLDERFTAGGETFNLATNQAAGAVTESGFIHLQRVAVDPFPRFVYAFRDVLIEKTVFMVHGQNTTVVLYRVRNGSESGRLILMPLVNHRDYHGNTQRGQMPFRVDARARGVDVEPVAGGPALHLEATVGRFSARPDWYLGMHYAAEAERGLNPVDDHFIPGFFEIGLEAGADRTFAVTGGLEPVELDPEAALREARARLDELERRSGCIDELARRLVRAADAFIVKRRSTGKTTIIAGYHWFTDWGRDAMVALPGLTLVTGRYGEAREILETFAGHVERGLIPNFFPDDGTRPLYNTVDASLWFCHAAYRYLLYSGDEDFVRKHIWPVLQDIIKWYAEGTDYNIGAGEDGLIRAGGPGVQLTWMDAKVDDWVVTPRHGKPVEVQALWYNALQISAVLAERLGLPEAKPGLAARVREGFRREFSHPDGYLYDLVGDDGKDGSVRPNQLLALSLPFTMLDPVPEGQPIVRRVWRQLYAHYGLRSLVPGDSRYRGVYGGDRPARDGAYHQGTAWSWLMGPFITAYRRVHGYSAASRARAADLVAPFADHLREHGIGFVSEIFDGDEPTVPRGCIAQAWGVAEVLRAYVEDVLEQGPIK
ncbi:MAG: glycogen debranching enzyme N-terminal domain-containing protein [Candidatus Desulforudis sp.]|nr:glycogen debranching enzyme N-terminal domain-containing protein [Desulforudis sp.]